MKILKNNSKHILNLMKELIRFQIQQNQSKFNLKKKKIKMSSIEI